jgi:hypothetical protein
MQGVQLPLARGRCQEPTARSIAGQRLTFPLGRRHSPPQGQAPPSLARCTAAALILSALWSVSRLWVFHGATRALAGRSLGLWFCRFLGLSHGVLRACAARGGHASDGIGDGIELFQSVSVVWLWTGLLWGGVLGVFAASFETPCRIPNRRQPAAVVFPGSWAATAVPAALKAASGSAGLAQSSIAPKGGAAKLAVSP